MTVELVSVYYVARTAADGKDVTITHGAEAFIKEGKADEKTLLTTTASSSTQALVFRLSHCYSNRFRIQRAINGPIFIAHDHREDYKSLCVTYGYTSRTHGAVTTCGT